LFRAHGTIFYGVMKANMKSGTELSVAELYALERAAHLARAREMGRLIRVGADALVRFANHVSNHILSAPKNGKDVSHA
jgi:hypothetical protein